MMSDENKPLIYSCTGCSNLAIIAYDIALNIDRDGMAEMSCMSGVVGNIEPIKQLAHSGRPIFVIDGCGLACTKSCTESCGLPIQKYFNLSDYGFDKRSKWDDSLTENSIAMKNIYHQLFDAGYSTQKKEV
jgi:uncharacterized metal-binding protein